MVIESWSNEFAFAKIPVLFQFLLVNNSTDKIVFKASGVVSDFLVTGTFVEQKVVYECLEEYVLVERSTQEKRYYSTVCASFELVNFLSAMI